MALADLNRVFTMGNPEKENIHSLILARRILCCGHDELSLVAIEIVDANLQLAW
jgi:hypothetical protein